MTLCPRCSGRVNLEALTALQGGGYEPVCVVCGWSGETRAPEAADEPPKRRVPPPTSLQKRPVRTSSRAQHQRMYA